MDRERYIVLVNYSAASIKEQQDDDSVPHDRKVLCIFPFGRANMHRERAIKDADKICKLLNEDYNK